MTTIKEAADWKKFSLKNARNAYISEDKITICMATKVKGDTILYNVEFPNAGFIHFCTPKDNEKKAKSFFRTPIIMSPSCRHIGMKSSKISTAQRFINNLSR